MVCIPFTRIIHRTLRDTTLPLLLTRTPVLIDLLRPPYPSLGGRTKLDDLLLFYKEACTIHLAR